MAANRSEIHAMMTTRASAMRQPGESAEQAMARFVATVQGAEMARLYQRAEPAPIEQRPGATTKPKVHVSIAQQRAMSAIEEAATAYREEHPDVTHEQAVVAVLEANPALYSEYVHPATLTLAEVSERVRQVAEELTGKRYGVELRDAAGDRVA